MQEIQTFAEANAVLARFVPTTRLATGYTLERMRQLMSFLGNPQNKLNIIHVAGTSGKTSTCYYAAALLKAAGFKVGLTVSPHVDEVNERVQVNGEPLAEKIFGKELSIFLKIIRTLKIEPTYFELLMAFAYWEFDRQKVDYAVIEVGLGGLLDGSNVIDREDKICVITDIGLDHVDLLGNTLPKIAAQKAGIIQPGNEVFCHTQSDEIIEVFKKRCKEQQANLHVLAPGVIKMAPDYLPDFQKRNFTLAEAAVNFTLQRDGHQMITEDQRQATAHTLIPARMETFQYGDKAIILDGSHNAQKLQTLIDSIHKQYPGQAAAVMVSFSDGKSYRLESSLQELTKLSHHMIITTFRKGQDYPHGPVDPQKLAQVAKDQGVATINIVTDPHAALKELLAQPEPLFIVTGSFFLVHDVRPEVQKL